MSNQSELLALPSSPIAREVALLVTQNAPPSLANHSFRSYLFARLVAEERGLAANRDYDQDLLFCSCALHDIGLTKTFSNQQRFEVDGADVAVQLLTRHGVSPADADLVWQAIALNTSPGIVERRGTLCALTFAGVALDFGGDAPFITDAMAGAIHQAYPRLAIGRALADTIIEQARLDPAKAPLFSMPAQTLRERTSPPHVTEIERIASQGRWRE